MNNLWENFELKPLRTGVEKLLDKAGVKNHNTFLKLSLYGLS